MAWETILATVTIEIGEHIYHASILRREKAPYYYIRTKERDIPFDGKGDDNVATVLGLSQIALLAGAELDKLKG